MEQDEFEQGPDILNQGMLTNRGHIAQQLFAPVPGEQVSAYLAGVAKDSRRRVPHAPLSRRLIE